MGGPLGASGAAFGFGGASSQSRSSSSAVGAGSGRASSLSNIVGGAASGSGMGVPKRSAAASDSCLASTAASPSSHSLSLGLGSSAGRPIGVAPPLGGGPSGSTVAIALTKLTWSDKAVSKSPKAPPRTSRGVAASVATASRIEAETRARSAGVAARPSLMRRTIQAADASVLMTSPPYLEGGRCSVGPRKPATTGGGAV